MLYKYLLNLGWRFWQGGEIFKCGGCSFEEAESWVHKQFYIFIFRRGTCAFCCLNAILFTKKTLHIWLGTHGEKNYFLWLLFIFVYSFTMSSERVFYLRVRGYVIYICLDMLTYNVKVISQKKMLKLSYLKI